MTSEDELAIDLAMQRRRAQEARQREEDARRAELPRTLREDAGERLRWLRALAVRVLRRLT